MGTMLLKIKIMPESVETNLEELKEKAKEIIESNEGKVPMFEEEPIAFGLKALIVNFRLEESKEIDPIENGLKEMEKTNSVEIIDMRRAFG